MREHRGRGALGNERRRGFDVVRVGKLASASSDRWGIWPRRTKASLPRPASVWQVFDSDFLHRLFCDLPASQRARYEGQFVVSHVASNYAFIVLCEWRDRVRASTGGRCTGGRQVAGPRSRPAHEKAATCTSSKVPVTAYEKEAGPRPHLLDRLLFQSAMQIIGMQQLSVHAQRGGEIFGLVSLVGRSVSPSHSHVQPHIRALARSFAVRRFVRSSFLRLPAPTPAAGKRSWGGSSATVTAKAVS